jgi:hypothetical protein
MLTRVWRKIKPAMAGFLSPFLIASLAIYESSAPRVTHAKLLYKQLDIPRYTKLAPKQSSVHSLLQTASCHRWYDVSHIHTKANHCYWGEEQTIVHDTRTIGSNSAFGKPCSTSPQN